MTANLGYPVGLAAACGALVLHPGQDLPVSLLLFPLSPLIHGNFAGASKEANCLKSVF